MTYQPTNCWPVGPGVPAGGAPGSPLESVGAACAFIAAESAAVRAAIAAAGPDAAIPDCPGWTGIELLEHLVEVHDFWGWVVAHRSLAPAEYEDPAHAGGTAAERLAATTEALAAATERLIAALAAATTDTPVWSWAGGVQDVSWVVRRMIHETAVHRVDAERAAGRDHRLDGALAVDGIAEYLAYFAVYGRPDVGGTVHLHCTDEHGEWTIDPAATDAAAAVVASHAKADVAVRGPASDVVLRLWGRGSTAELFGDVDVLERFLAGRAV